jgi:HSP20 family protein
MALNKTTVTLPFLKRSLLETADDLRSAGTWTPNTDVYVTETGLVVKVELSGMRKEDLDLTVEASQLRVAGVRRDGCRAAQCRFVAMEINYGPFETVVEVPPGYELASAKAAYQNGFLRIDVPRSPVLEIPPGAAPIRTHET